VVAICSGGIEHKWMISYLLIFSGSSLFLVEDVESMSTGTDLQYPEVKICTVYYHLLCSSDVRFQPIRIELCNDIVCTN
jgi:hypothetical protein